MSNEYKQGLIEGIRWVLTKKHEDRSAEQLHKIIIDHMEEYYRHYCIYENKEDWDAEFRKYEISKQDRIRLAHQFKETSDIQKAAWQAGYAHGYCCGEHDGIKHGMNYVMDRFQLGMTEEHRKELVDKYVEGLMNEHTIG